LNVPSLRVVSDEWKMRWGYVPELDPLSLPTESIQWRRRVVQVVPLV
jgi:hypothetical protein